ncbi:hypothetical protein WICMUC_004100 [Wickerhamomyces mucosus]|uniref:Ubiquitinyl hydrolase 1 n=1 Tax=Wickerhamomyces mucosus TaxID=1378264 RepID=A0A9P8TBI9_9ASCO|nr:hypothetical protein WICMUC_004100 [Wickerhamomyces mucosus]
MAITATNLLIKQPWIKLEIKQQLESDLYDSIQKLFKFDGSLVEIKDIDDPTQKSIDKIINTNSADKDNEIKSWQQEFIQCEHTIEFHQHSLETIDLSKCSDCGLEENLWICLTCGKLGCGRAQFGGVPGNSHALEHFKLAGHPIAVKLGSLSKEVMDIFCYQCDEEIVFPQAASLLKTYGIDVSNFVKTEKSLVELQIEQNLNWEFNLKNENGENLPIVNGSGLTGLKNLGNSCYLSSVIQTLFSIPDYQTHFNIPVEAFNNEDSNDLNFQLNKIKYGLLSGDFAKPDEENEEGYQSGISLKSFKHLIGESHDEFSSMRQQDAFEFWNYLIDKIDKVDGDLNNIFRFISVEKINLPNKRVKLKQQINENITLITDNELEEIDGVKTYRRQDFLDILIQYLSPEDIELNGEHAQKTNFFKTYPKYLLTAIQRIKLENWVPIKTDVPLTIPESFDLKDFQSPEIKEVEKVKTFGSFCSIVFARFKSRYLLRDHLGKPLALQEFTVPLWFFLFFDIFKQKEGEGLVKNSN